MDLLSDSGKRVRLTRPLTRAGGEGQVWEIDGMPSMVAKIYHKPPDSQKVARLQYQIRGAKPELKSIAAWPVEMLYDSSSAVVKGIVMPRVSGKEIHKLYGPTDRHNEFPSAEWDFLVHVAMNCAAAFEALHQAGAVMADVNEGNLMVKEGDGRIGLIDCDSYQISNGSDLFLCNVGIAMWTPPELQGINFTGLRRTANHDLFGLAVIIFRLLFMGRHPFSGVPKKGDQLPVEEAIKSYHFAYSGKTSHIVNPPPAALSLREVPPKIGELFERAFLRGSEKDGARPTGREWANELKTLLSAMKKGCIDPGHKFWNGLNACPWCAIERAGGPNFFIAVRWNKDNLTADFNAFWAAIERVIQGPLMHESVIIPNIGSPPARPMQSPPPSPINLTAPVEPLKPTALQKNLPSTPQLPNKPVFKRPAAIIKMPMGPNETLARLGALGACFFAILLILLLKLEVVAARYGAGWAVVACGVFSMLKMSNAKQERKNRLETDQAAGKSAQSRAEEEHRRLMEEHERTVNEITKKHLEATARAEADYQREWQRRDQEYQTQYNDYLAGLRQFEAVVADHAEAEKRWKSECDLRFAFERQTRQQVETAVEQLRQQLHLYRHQVTGQIQGLEVAKQRFTKAKSDEIAAMRGLHQKRLEIQKRVFLQSKRIEDANIPNIGPVKLRNLQAYSIDTAWDIRPGIKVPGFGPTMMSHLLGWRSDCETQFRFNPNLPLPPAEVNAVKMKYSRERQAALMDVRSGASKLQALESQARTAVSRAKIEILERAREHAQAHADLSVC